MPDPEHLTVELHFGTIVGEDYIGGGSPEEPPDVEPVTLRDAIVGACAAQLIGDGGTRSSLRAEALKVVRDRAEELLAGEVEDIVRRALDDEIVTGDGFSERKTTLRAVVVEHARALIGTTGAYGRNTLTKETTSQIDAAIKADLQAELNAAKEAVRAQVSAKAAELLAAETLRAAGIR